MTSISKPKREEDADILEVGETEGVPVEILMGDDLTRAPPVIVIT